MTYMHHAAVRRNARDGYDDLPLFAFRPPTEFDHRSLTPGGAVLYRMTRRPPATCNLLASLAGLGNAEGV